MHTPEDRLFTSLRNIVGAAEYTEKVAEDQSASEVAEFAPMSKLASMSVEEIMNNEIFLKGVSDRVEQRGYDIEAILQQYITD